MVVIFVHTHQCEQWSDVPQCQYVVVAASDHFSDVTVHRLCRVKRDAISYLAVSCRSLHAGAEVPAGQTYAT